MAPPRWNSSIERIWRARDSWARRRYSFGSRWRSAAPPAPHRPPGGEAVPPSWARGRAGHLGVGLGGVGVQRDGERLAALPRLLGPAERLVQRGRGAVHVAEAQPAA